MSGWEGSDRKVRLPDDWPALVQKVKNRDGGRCRWILPSRARCPRAGTDVDHIRPGDDHSLHNLRLLCAHHHAKKSAMEGRAAKDAIKAKRYREPERHPGTIR